MTMNKIKELVKEIYYLDSNHYGSMKGTQEMIAQIIMDSQHDENIVQEAMDILANSI